MKRLRRRQYGIRRRCNCSSAGQQLASSSSSSRIAKRRRCALLAQALLLERSRKYLVTVVTLQPARLLGAAHDRAAAGHIAPITAQESAGVAVKWKSTSVSETASQRTRPIPEWRRQSPSSWWCRNA